MVLFDTLIQETLNLLKDKEAQELQITENLRADAGKNNMVFASEKAYELGGDKNRSLSFELTTSSPLFPKEDQILLYGKDLNEISTDSDFVRITLLQVNEDEIGGNELYKRLETVRFTKYRVSPEGYMLRTSTHNKEKIRLSKDCAQDSFSRIGSAYIKAYKMIPYVRSVRIIFMTGNHPQFEGLENIARRKDNITETIDHILKGMVLNDCNACSVKELCDEVEGLRKIHEEEKRNA